ncbi:MAG TPA: hypothetical protein VL092_06105 [Chitinophagaceae bacterium]|nr:hypothetical protein [Chitinophagaceae bacterium]
MVAVLMTDIRDADVVTSILEALRLRFPALKFNFDLDDYVEKPFPCGHSVLRAEGTQIQGGEIISLVIDAGFQCRELEDKVCG